MGRSISSVSGIVLLFLTMAFFACNGKVNAQSADIQGIVMDHDNGQPLEGAHIIIQSQSSPDSGDVQVAASDANGLYQISGIEPGEYILRVSYIGYLTHEDTLDLEAEQRERMSVVLRRDPRDSLLTDPRPIDATVTLEHTASGETAVLNDSLFKYANDAYAWNFWTTMELHPEETYRLTAKETDGDSIGVKVTLPPDYPTPLVQLAPEEIDDPDLVYIDGIEHLADVQTIYRIRHPQTGQYLFSFPHVQDTVDTPDADYLITIDPDEDLEIIQERIGDVNDEEIEITKQISVAVAGPGWPFFPGLNENVIALPEGISNVKNGTGYVAGIVSKTFPYKSCFDEKGERVPCSLEESIRSAAESNQ